MSVSIVRKTAVVLIPLLCVVSSVWAGAYDGSLDPGIWEVTTEGSKIAWYVSKPGVDGTQTVVTGSGQRGTIEYTGKTSDWRVHKFHYKWKIYSRDPDGQLVCVQQGELTFYKEVEYWLLLRSGAVGLDQHGHYTQQPGDISGRIDKVYSKAPPQ